VTAVWAWGGVIGWLRCDFESKMGLSENWVGRRKRSGQFLSLLMFVGCHITEEHK
jgi:hypothetical protein